MAELFKISNPNPGFRTGSTMGVWSAIQRLPAPVNHKDAFEHWREEANASLRRIDDHPRGRKFDEAKRELREKLQGLLFTYLRSQSK